MHTRLEHTIGILERLVSFRSLPGQPTTEIVGFIQSELTRHGIDCVLSYDDAGKRANLFAAIGPQTSGGVLLNGHTDVVPVEGQNWATDPFTLTRLNDKLFGRGAVDMKGFLACMIATAPLWQQLSLKKPVYLAFTFDEEIGGYGMPVLLRSMKDMNITPYAVIVGEPTQCKLITGHKGGYEMRTEITGYEVHSCDPTKGVNAISVATAFISKIEEIGKRFAANPDRDSLFQPPYATFNIGTIEGGMARNATAGRCNFNWELRQMPGDNGAAIIQEIQHYAYDELLPAMRTVNKNTDIKVTIEAPVPPLDDRNADDAAALISQLTGINSRGVVSFGSDAGYFSDAGFSTVLYGPGSIDRAHKPDEYITTTELDQGLELMDKLAEYLSR